jgi:undecaprenyl-diphosphatase
MIDWIQHIDAEIVLWVQTHFRSSVNDAIIPWFRQAWFWLPVYVFLLYFMLSKFGKQGGIWCVFFLLIFAMGDSFSAQVLKPLFHRVRPCNNDALMPYLLNMPVRCGVGYSFPSTHATNHSAFAAFIISTLHRHFPKQVWLALIWAFLVCFAQLYVAVHYPSDLLGGMVLGTLIGVGMGWAFMKRFGWQGV